MSKRNYLNPFAAGWKFGQHEIMTKICEMTETMENGYSPDSTQWELSNEYNMTGLRRVWLLFCYFVHWTEVTLAAEELSYFNLSHMQSQQYVSEWVVVHLTVGRDRNRCSDCGLSALTYIHNQIVLDWDAPM